MPRDAEGAARDSVVAYRAIRLGIRNKAGCTTELDYTEQTSWQAELRALWSDPETRRKLLGGLAERGFGREQLAEMQRIIDAEKSDLFDVLAHVAYAMPPLTRVSAGVDELDPEKLTPLLRLRYRDSIADAIADLGRPEEIGKVFAGFQRFLYERAA